MTVHYPQPQPSKLTKESVHRLAERVAEQLSYTPGSDIFKTVSDLGGRIVFQDFSGLADTDSGSLWVHGPANFEVRVATNTSPLRDRFTIAHEIGHYILHYVYPHQTNAQNAPATMAANRYGSDRTEWEANWFAAAFLMPEAKFLAACEEHDRNLSKVASAFGVSLSAAQTRAKALGIVA